MSNKVIFLDIDGVIQSPRYCVSTQQTGVMCAFEPAAMNFLRIILENTGAKIVISSTWRIGDYETSRNELKMIFCACGYSEIAEAFHTDWRTENLNAIRGTEIKEWLDRHKNIKEYLILDDDNDMLPEQKDRFVKTDPMNGFLLQHFDDALMVFGIDSSKLGL